MNIELLKKYLEETEFNISSLPVDLYCLQERINNENKSNKDVVREKPLTPVLPNELKKYDYRGINHLMPIAPISQIFDLTKIF